MPEIISVTVAIHAKQAFPHKKDFLNIFGAISFAKTIFSAYFVFFEYAINALKISSSIKDYTIKSNSRLSLISHFYSHLNLPTLRQLVLPVSCVSFLR